MLKRTGFLRSLTERPVRGGFDKEGADEESNYYPREELLLLSTPDKDAHFSFGQRESQ
jgi:hypothetical protein